MTFSRRSYSPGRPGRRRRCGAPSCRSAWCSACGGKPPWFSYVRDASQVREVAARSIWYRRGLSTCASPTTSTRRTGPMHMWNADDSFGHRLRGALRTCTVTEDALLLGPCCFFCCTSRTRAGRRMAHWLHKRECSILMLRVCRGSNTALGGAVVRRSRPFPTTCSTCGLDQLAPRPGGPGAGRSRPRSRVGPDHRPDRPAARPAGATRPARIGRRAPATCSKAG